MQFEKETYLQFRDGEATEDVDMADIHNAIQQLQRTEGAQAMFWVGVIEEEEQVLEVDKDGTVTMILTDEEEEHHFSATLKDWKEVAQLFEWFILDEMQKVKSRIVNG